jgi:hypothetical protein
MLTPEQLEELCGNAIADIGEYVMRDGADEAAYFEARRVIAAMRTPITAEALVQAGWAEASGLPGCYLKEPWYCYIVFKDGALDSVQRGATDFNCRTMHDLAELARLLGVEA